MIKAVRERSCNKSIGVMVGGPVFIKRPELAMRVGADAAAVDAPASLILAQKLIESVGSGVRASTVA